MYEEGGEQQVTLVAHSMGEVVTLYFLTSVVTQEWKDRYINAFIPLCADWSGAYGAIESVIFLDSNANPIFRGLDLTPVQRTQESNYQNHPFGVRQYLSSHRTETTPLMTMRASLQTSDMNRDLKCT